jgi:hypothetical protein
MKDNNTNTLNTNITTTTSNTLNSNNTSTTASDESCKYYTGWKGIIEKRRTEETKNVPQAKLATSDSEDSFFPSVPSNFTASTPSDSSVSTPKLNTLSTNFTSTIDSTRTGNSGGLVDAGISSLGSAPTNSEIKYVKFKNYGLHKSLGENLNNIESIISGGSSAASSSNSYKNQRTDSSGVNSYISKSTMNLTTNGSSFFESGFYDSNNTTYCNMYEKKLKNGKSTEKQETKCNRENRYSLCKNYKNEFNSTKYLNSTPTRDDNRGRNCYTPSVPLNSRSMFKSCSPQRSKRSSQVDYKYANPIVIRRAQTNFVRFEPRPVEKPSAQINLQKSEGLIKKLENFHT